MSSVAIFMNGGNQAIRIPKKMNFEGVTRLQVEKHGDTILMMPLRPSWSSFLDVDKADDDFMVERENVLLNKGGFDFDY